MAVEVAELQDAVVAQPARAVVVAAQMLEVGTKAAVVVAWAAGPRAACRSSRTLLRRGG